VRSAAAAEHVTALHFLQQLHHDLCQLGPIEAQAAPIRLENLDRYLDQPKPLPPAVGGLPARGGAALLEITGHGTGSDMSATCHRPMSPAAPFLEKTSKSAILPAPRADPMQRMQ
jgi:hypothetical protein